MIERVALLPRGVTVLMVLASTVATACGASPITSRRIEAALRPTFANLVQLQLGRVGLPRVAASAIDVKAGCRKLVPDTGLTGAGDWVCTLVFAGPNRVPLTDTYDLVVGTDGCYTATVEGAEAEVGGPTTVRPDGQVVRNLLFTFEGCFDPGS